MKEKVSALVVLHELADRDEKEAVFAFPLTNFKRAQTGKDGWGEITIAVSNHVIANIDRMVGSLYMADREKYAEIEIELQKGGAK